MKTKEGAIKDGRLQEIIKDLAAKFAHLEASKSSMITITRVMAGDQGRNIFIYFTTLPDSAQEHAKEFLNRKRSEFSEYVAKHSRVGRIPHIEFEIDLGEKNRQRADELLG